VELSGDDGKRHRPHAAGGVLQNALSSFVIGCTRVRLRPHMQAPYMLPILVSVKAEIGESGTEKSYYQCPSKTGCDDKRRIVEIKRPSNRATSAPFLELSSFPFAVGMPVAWHPPHRSQRAILSHWAPALSHHAKTLFWIRMIDTGDREPLIHVPLHTLPGDIAFVAPS